MTYLQARTANEVLKAQERRLRLQQLKGELVDRARAVALVFRLARQERDSCSTELQEQSLHDAMLTSLLNRRGILVSLEPLVARSRRYNSPLSVVAMGLDTGSAPDKARVQVSYLLKDQTRWADLVGCNQDGEFILILQETTQDSALHLVEKLSAHLSGLSKEQQSPVSARYGVTQCQKNDDAESLLERVEGALAEARSNHSGMTIAV